MLLALGSAAEAGVARTWVGSSGNDSNTATNCTRAAPCKTFAAAYSVTQSGGEIVALDSVGYGPITITTPLTIIGLEGAFVSVQSNTTGITINAGATDVVVLDNIVISGAAGSSNTKGIVLSTGRLVLQNSKLRGLTTGLTVTSTHADVVNTDFMGNTLAIQTTGAGGAYNSGIGIWLCPCTTLVRINAGNFISNTTVFNENNPTSTSGQSSATIYVFQSGTQFSANVTGYTTLMTVTGTGAVPPGPGVQTYGGSSAPN